MGSAKARGQVMALIGGIILIYNGTGYISGLFQGRSALTILGLVFVVIGMKMARSGA